jgi:hypothetical protein
VRAPPRTLVLLLGIALAALAAVPGPARASGDEEEDDAFDAPARRDDGRRLSLMAFGGELSAFSGSGRASAPIYGGEVAWRFEAVELGVLGQAARLRSGESDWSPIVLLRITERFQSRRGLEGSISFGIGGAREDRWRTWFQVGLGARLDLGPIFLNGEVGFEQADFIRLAAGLGTRF